MIQKSANYINHIALVLDASGSMAHLKSSVIRVADEQIKTFAKQSELNNQETRVSVYTFDYAYNIQCLIFDKDVLRLPSIAGLYTPDGATALRDAIGKSIEDLEKTAQMYGDHAFLVYVITDGAENDSKVWSIDRLKLKVQARSDNWTFGAFVPNRQGEMSMQNLGFPFGNIVTWEQTEAGLRDVGTKMAAATSSYYGTRSRGIRSTSSLFNVGTGGLKPADVKGAGAVALTPGQFRMLAVTNDTPISDFVEAKTRRAYRLGEGYYQLTKKETIQAGKKIALYHRGKHTVYTGDAARQLLNLPDYEVRVDPSQGGDYDIFVQSTSTNRKLLGGTTLLVLS